MTFEEAVQAAFEKLSVPLGDCGNADGIPKRKALDFAREVVRLAGVEVEYIESGSFAGGEEDVDLAGIKRGEVCMVIKVKEE